MRRNDDMNDTGAIFGVGFVIGLVFALVATFSLFFVQQPDLGDHYKQGQIDYANDIIKYELREQDNHEYIWVKKEDDNGTLR
jgi:hypothetical protein